MLFEWNFSKWEKKGGGEESFSKVLLYAFQTILLFRPYTRKFRGRNTLEIEADCWQGCLCSRDARYMYAMSQLRSSLFSETCQKYEHEGRAIIWNLCLFVASRSLPRKLNICLIIAHFSSSFPLPSNLILPRFPFLLFKISSVFFFTRITNRDTFTLFLANKIFLANVRFKIWINGSRS